MKINMLIYWGLPWHNDRLHREFSMLLDEAQAVCSECSQKSGELFARKRCTCRAMRDSWSHWWLCPTCDSSLQARTKRIQAALYEVVDESGDLVALRSRNLFDNGDDLYTECDICHTNKVTWAEITQLGICWALQRQGRQRRS